ncbi:MAG: glycosyltransferase 61 family protein [Chloroflexota bacterium]
MPIDGPRRVANEADVIRALRPLGFEVVHAERLTFAEQIRLFSEAAVVIGPHGSGMTNVLFAEELVLIELVRAAAKGAPGVPRARRRGRR